MEKTKQEIEWAAKRILDELDYPILRRVNLRVSARQTRAGGSARFRLGQPFEIVISLPFFANPANWDNLHEVVTHEAAHCVAGHAAGHGLAWRSVHRAMGGTGKRCHSMELATSYAHKKRKRAERKPVPCPKCGQSMLLGPSQYRKYQQGVCYSHGRCPS